MVGTLLQQAYFNFRSLQLYYFSSQSPSFEKYPIFDQVELHRYWGIRIWIWIWIRQLFGLILACAWLKWDWASEYEFEYEYEYESGLIWIKHLNMHLNLNMLPKTCLDLFWREFALFWRICFVMKTSLKIVGSNHVIGFLSRWRLLKFQPSSRCWNSEEEPRGLWVFRQKLPRSSDQHEELVPLTTTFHEPTWSRMKTTAQPSPPLTTTHGCYAFCTPINR